MAHVVHVSTFQEIYDLAKEYKPERIVCEPIKMIEENKKYS